MSKDEAISVMKNSELKEKVYHCKYLKNYTHAQKV